MTNRKKVFSVKVGNGMDIEKLQWMLPNGAEIVSVARDGDRVKFVVAHESFEEQRYVRIDKLPVVEVE